MEEADKDWVMIRNVSSVPAHPGRPGQRAVKRLLCCAWVTGQLADMPTRRLSVCGLDKFQTRQLTDTSQVADRKLVNSQMMLVTEK